MLFFEHIAILTLVGLVYLVRQLCEVNFQYLNEQGSFVVVESQGMHISFPFGVLEKAVGLAYSGFTPFDGLRRGKEIAAVNAVANSIKAFFTIGWNRVNLSDLIARVRLSVPRTAIQSQLYMPQQEQNDEDDQD